MQRQLERVERKRHRLAVEVAVREHLAPLGEHDRVVGGRVQLDRRPPLRRRRPRRARRRAPAARTAASRRPAPGRTSGATRRSRSRPAAGTGSRPTRPGRGAGAAPAARAQTASAIPRTASIVCAAATSASFTSRRARASTSAPIAAMNWVPLISASPSFAASTIGSRPARASASAPGIASPPTRAKPSPTSTRPRCASGARSPLAPSDPREGTTGCTPAGEHVEQQPDGLDADARRPLRERVCPQQRGRPHHLVGERLADAAGVAAQQVQLQLGGLRRARSGRRRSGRSRCSRRTWACPPRRRGRSGRATRRSARARGRPARRGRRRSRPARRRRR